MALFYNNDGTISEIEIKAMIFGKVTSSLVTAPTIQQAFQASASKAIYMSAMNAGSSSNKAYELAYPSGSLNRNARN
jgi:hypothetical protein